jgi:hypothetical protein
MASTKVKRMRYRVLAGLVLLVLTTMTRADEPLRIAVFHADVTPPVGTPLCDALCKPAKEIVDPLSARGVVLLGAGQPIVLCALDWVGVGNSGHDTFRAELARAAGTTTQRVAVHCLHQHDAPGCDFEADELLKPLGLGGKLFDPVFARQAMARVAMAVQKALDKPAPVTHIALARAQVYEVASNRRVLGPDGKVKYTRTSATKNPAARAEPEGVIDPFVHLLAFWADERPLASLTYYATHPQSYYCQGGVSCDFPGLARGLRDQEMPGVLHVHFNGAGGNVTAGKYNDGNPANRPILAARLARGMKEAYDSQKKLPIKAADVEWRVTSAALPVSPLYTTPKQLEARIADDKVVELDRLRAARNLAWARRSEAGHKIDIGCLRLGAASVLHMPGELFIEYQLLAQKMKPDAPVLMAAYGDYGPGYIGTAVSYTQGGYETGPVSRVGPGAEEVLTRAMRELLR